jgi:hypothetical protein
MVPVLSHIDLVHNIQAYLFKINFCNIIVHIIDIWSFLFPEDFPVTKIYAA